MRKSHFDSRFQLPQLIYEQDKLLIKLPLWVRQDVIVRSLVDWLCGPHSDKLKIGIAINLNDRELHQFATLPPHVWMQTIYA